MHACPQLRFVRRRYDDGDDGDYDEDGGDEDDEGRARMRRGMGRRADDGSPTRRTRGRGRGGRGGRGRGNNRAMMGLPPLPSSAMPQYARRGGWRSGASGAVRGSGRPRGGAAHAEYAGGYLGASHSSYDQGGVDEAAEALIGLTGPAGQDMGVYPEPAEVSMDLPWSWA